MTVTPFILSSIILLMKVTILSFAIFIFFIFGKDGKTPDLAMNLIWSFGIGGPLFLSSGIFLENFYRILYRCIVFFLSIKLFISFSKDL